MKDTKNLEKDVIDLVNNSFLKSHIKEFHSEIPIIQEINYASGILFVLDNTQKYVKAINQPTQEEVVIFIQAFAKLHGKEFNETNPYLKIRTNSYRLGATCKPISTDTSFNFQWKSTLFE